jgi:hypothetical protein
MRHDDVTFSHSSRSTYMAGNIFSASYVLQHIFSASYAYRVRCFPSIIEHPILRHPLFLATLK